MAGSPVLVRYADDLVAFCHTRQEAEQVKARLAAWLAPRGLVFNEDKTRVVSLGEGFDFLGFNVRRYRGKLLIKPSKAAVKRIRERLRTELRSLRGANAQAVIARLNPIIRGWSAYYRTAVSSEIFRALDHYLWKLTYKWAKHSHPNKPVRSIVRRYFGSSVSPGTTSGCSVTATAALTCSGSPGRKSSGTRWSRAPRHVTIPPWPATGPPGGAGACPGRWTPPACGSWSHSTASAHCADNCSWTPTARPKPRASGNNG
jgi:RNA-directed DNA polymerase